ncbi:unnamed protein product [Lupinus luteus]|uniref:Uncharacterized protein n=1 Tax=Lupinus luteus TaxID=3873 RepID=A0AAV1WCG6_LUPLU
MALTAGESMGTSVVPKVRLGPSQADYDHGIDSDHGVSTDTSYFTASTTGRFRPWVTTNTFWVMTLAVDESMGTSIVPEVRLGPSQVDSDHGVSTRTSWVTA